MKSKIVIRMSNGRAVEIPIDGEVSDAAKLNEMAGIFNTQHFPTGSYVQLFRIGCRSFVIENVDEIEFVEDNGVSAEREPAMTVMGNSIARIEALIKAQGGTNMTTLAEIQQDIEEMRQAAQRNADAADAGIALINQLMGMIGDAAASATDLAALKANIDTITDQVNAKADALVAAANETPPAP